MKIKTSELTGTKLAYAVGVADKRIMRNGIGRSLEVRGRTEDGEELPDSWDMWMLWYPQDNWSQGGPIIEREAISVVPCESMEEWAADMQFRQGVETQYGPTPLIAAMRCFVYSRLGDEVDVPDELLGD